MSGKDLFEGMSYVDERFIDEAETRMIPKRSVSPWLKAASMAACLCLIVFGLYNLNQYLNLGETEGAAGDSAADEAWPGIGQENGAEYELEQDSHESIINAQEDGPVEEVPSVILQVDEMTDTGFIGTVAELLDTDIFEIGMELHVVVAGSTRYETADGNSSEAADSKTDFIGSYVMVQFIKYNEDAGMILVNLIQEVESPKDTP